MKIMKHVGTRAFGSKPNKIAKSGSDVIDVDDDDFDQSRGYRKAGVVKKRRKGRVRKKNGTEVLGPGKCQRTRSEPNKIDQSGAIVVEIDDDAFNLSQSRRKSCPIKERVVGGACQQHQTKLGLGLKIAKQGLEHQPQKSENELGIEFCPICQFPFRNLIAQSVEFHVSSCLDNHDKISNRGECPKGLDCSSISQEHFRLFLHTKQAFARSDSSMALTDANISAQTEEDSYCGLNLPERDVQQTPVKNIPDEVDLNSPHKSVESSSFLDDSYDRILSELVDELENDDLIVSDSMGCDSGHAKAGIECSLANAESENSCSWDERLQSTETANTVPISSTAVATSFLSGISSSPSSMEAKKLQQTNLRSYFGVKGTKTKKTIVPQKEQSKFQVISSFTNQATKPGKGKSSNSGDYGSFNSKKVRSCPFYKKIPGTSITVDAFSYGDIPGCTAYFLSHFHYDHYGGLKKSFTNKIYCSKVTAQLVHMKIKVNEKYIHTLPMNEEVKIDNVRVTLLDANHCPGSVMFLFALPNGCTILHTGDFRANVSMGNFLQLQNIKIDTIFLDTTYCNPSYNFPTQQSTIDFAVQKSCKAVQLNPKTLIVCGTYSVGKERVFVSIANALDCKICAATPKRRILDCLEWPELSERLTANWGLAQVHVLPMNQINDKALKKHLSSYREFQNLLAFKPTGWTHNERLTDLSKIRPTVSGPVTIYGIPYSEHSSYSELEWFVKRFRPGKIIPTVNVGSPAVRSSMQKIFDEWLRGSR